jgi:hypothetical protein
MICISRKKLDLKLKLALPHARHEKGILRHITAQLAQLTDIRTARLESHRQ